jgi:hypothetical protein
MLEELPAQLDRPVVACSGCGCSNRGQKGQDSSRPDVP